MTKKREIGGVGVMQETMGLWNVSDCEKQDRAFWEDLCAGGDSDALLFLEASMVSIRVY